jgi:hypothetical protein
MCPGDDLCALRTTHATEDGPAPEDDLFALSLSKGTRGECAGGDPGTRVHGPGGTSQIH